MQTKIKDNKILTLIFQCLAISLGTIVMSFAFTVFLTPNRLIPGGFMGLSQIIYDVFSKLGFTAISVSVWYLILNSVLYVFAVKKLGWKFGVKTAVGILSYSLFVEMMKKSSLIVNLINKINNEGNASLMLYAIIGGVILGVGMGIVFLAKGSTGGCDTLAVFINKIFPTITTGQLVITVDTIIVFTSAIVYQSLVLPLYTLITIFIIGKVSDIFVGSMQSIRAYYIVTSKKEEMAGQILKELKRGVTSIKCEGMFTRHEKDMLFVMIKANQINQLKEIVKSCDKTSFMFSTSIKEVYGKGFIEFSNKTPKKHKNQLESVNNSIQTNGDNTTTNADNTTQAYADIKTEIKSQNANIETTNQDQQK